MSRFEMRLPDVGEGVAEAEIVEWFVAVGDRVTPDTVVAEVLTDKATVEVSAPVDGVVAELHGEPGDVLAVGGDLIAIDTDTPGNAEAGSEPGHASSAGGDTPGPMPNDTASDTASGTAVEAPVPARPPGERAAAAPAVRARATSLGIDLSSIAGTGPDGRVVHGDLDQELLRRIDASTGGQPAARPAPATSDGVSTPVRGLRRRIAERLSAAWNDIPHITYVDDVDVTEVERLRRELNDRPTNDGVHLTLLPFLARALVLAVADQPRLNAHYDHASETLTTFAAVHIGIATQTDDGLLVPVVRHGESLGLRNMASEIGRVTAAAREGSARREELGGSTITVTSLGALGGLVTTPIINPPEVAIIGVNKIETRPVWRDGTVQPRQVMNLSSSFDHRMVDGWDAATFVQRIKALLETPALLFVDER
ncbi:dihydrolipoamide acetyltransferase family protein [Ilumatobacter coccineus]|uniref:Dihydrolipoamide acetyltransferase component of pyruvate dehydrogenase complex n=1 Tax=Ilumatobacter coccineus (strain NBRC 103263 / KCTC 29153 / YM16-304) TaxID=1313172 RepID=A0A6C7EDP9_ILUCY|nr:dihydrolipoamide acetyltransferase family protein [Ilumatobacter coccineus]BAN02106.1 dihydrolipoyl transacylase [Ilumatobacter coccineus YM16-304]